MVWNGGFDCNTTLKRIVSYLGGVILNYLGRLNWREGDLECKEDPEVYFKKIFYDIAGPVRTPFIKMVRHDWR